MKTYGQTEGRMDGRKDVGKDEWRVLFYRTLLAEAGGPINHELFVSSKYHKVLNKKEI